MPLELRRMQWSHATWYAPAWASLWNAIDLPCSEGSAVVLSSDWCCSITSWGLPIMSATDASYSLFMEPRLHAVCNRDIFCVIAEDPAHMSVQCSGSEIWLHVDIWLLWCSKWLLGSGYTITKVKFTDLLPSWMKWAYHISKSSVFPNNSTILYVIKQFN